MLKTVHVRAEPYAHVAEVVDGSMLANDTGTEEDSRQFKPYSYAQQHLRVYTSTLSTGTSKPHEGLGG